MIWISFSIITTSKEQRIASLLVANAFAVNMFWFCGRFAMLQITWYIGTESVLQDRFSRFRGMYFLSSM